MGTLNGRIKELHAEGKSVTEIRKIVSQEFGRDIKYQRVYNTLMPLGPITNGGERRTGVAAKIKSLLEEGKSMKEICVSLQVYPNQVYQVKKKLQKAELEGAEDTQ